MPVVAIVVIIVTPYLKQRIKITYIIQTKRDENTPNLSTMENTGLKDGVGINVMLPASTLHKYYSMEYNK